MVEKIERPSHDAEISRKRARDGDYWSAQYRITKQRLADAIKAVGRPKVKGGKDSKPG